MYKTILTKPLLKYLKNVLNLLEYRISLKQTRGILVNWDCPIFALELFQDREWPFLVIDNTIRLQILTNNHTVCMHVKGNIIRMSAFFQWLKFINRQLGLAFHNSCSVWTDRKKKKTLVSFYCRSQSNTQKNCHFTPQLMKLYLKERFSAEPKYISLSEHI